MKKAVRKNIHLGTLIHNYLNENRIHGTTLASMIGKTGQMVTLYKSSPGMRTNTLEDVCYALEHNFFQDLANHLPSDFTVDARLNAGHNQLIAQLQEENKVLRIQNELLMKLKG